MKEDLDYMQDIAEMRTLMERSSKFLSLSGLAGVLAGIYALAGALFAYVALDFDPVPAFDSRTAGNLSSDLPEIILVALTVLILAVGTAIFLSYKRAMKRREKFWNPTTRRLLTHMAVPLLTGGFLILIFIAKGWIGLMAPFSLLFYGLALFAVSKFTFEEVKGLGLIQIGLGLFSSYFIEYGLVCWALGFGIAHIVYGIYLHYRYER